MILYVMDSSAQSGRTTCTGKGKAILIEVKHLTKQYGDHIAVDDLSFTIEKGKIYGFLGPNGAGKSTTMNIITGCLAATSGSITIDGHDIYKEPAAAKRCIGFLPELPPVYQDMTPKEYLQFVGEVKGVTKADMPAAVQKAMEQTGIVEMQSRLIRHLSKGYRQRVGIAQAIIGDPEVIILDEPTVGLDPLQIIEVRDLIRDLGKDHTVILSSHILSEVAAVCDEILIISRGRLVANDTPDNLSKMLQESNVLHLSVMGTEAQIRYALAGVDGINALEFGEGESGSMDVHITSDSSLDLRESVFSACAASNLPLLSMQLEKISLEDVFRQLTSDENPELVERFAAAAEEAAEEAIKAADAAMEPTAVGPESANPGEEVSSEATGASGEEGAE